MEEINKKDINDKNNNNLQQKNYEIEKQKEEKNENIENKEETINKRLATFERETKPIVEEFESKNILIKIDGMKSVDDITKDVSEQFNQRGLN